MRVISYNLRKHKASGELVSLARNFGIDALCLQECDAAELPDTLGPLHLADFTKGHRLGMAIYYRTDRFTARENKTFALHTSMHDRVMAPAYVLPIGTRLVDNATDHELVIG